MQYQAVAEALASSMPKLDALTSTGLAQWVADCLAIADAIDDAILNFDYSRFLAVCKGEQ